MTHPTSRTFCHPLPLLVLLVPSAMAASACSDDSAEGTPHDRVVTERIAPADPDWGMGGAGGATGGDPGVWEPTSIACFEPIVLGEDGRPECFVAEISAQPLDCSAPGREELQDERERTARTYECAERGLAHEECQELSICGIIKLDGDDRIGCQEGESPAAGYCRTNELSSECYATFEDSILVTSETGTAVPADPSATLLVYCAVEERE